jgi:hypothetical protein
VLAPAGSAFAQAEPSNTQEAPKATLSITRAPGTAEVVGEGGTMGVTLLVTNAVKGQTFELWHANTMNADDFERSLAADLAAAGLPEGVSVEAKSPMRAMVTLAPGTYAITVLRKVARDGVTESRDQGPWWDGDQEQTDINVGNETGGLAVEERVVSNWVTDVPAGQDAPDRVAAVQAIPAQPMTDASTRPPGAVAKVAIDRTAGSPQILFEGLEMSVTIQVTNAIKGQTFQLWHANTMSEADFEKPLLADVQAGLPEGVTATAVSPLRVTITLKDGSYALPVKRRTILDGETEGTDQAKWISGNQEQTDIFIGNPSSGLDIGQHVVSNWVTDSARTAVSGKK